MAHFERVCRMSAPRMFDQFGKYDRSPVCDDGGHDCASYAACSECEGKYYCHEHLRTCLYCGAVLCLAHAPQHVECCVYAEPLEEESAIEMARRLA